MNKSESDGLQEEMMSMTMVSDISNAFQGVLFRCIFIIFIKGKRVIGNRPGPGLNNLFPLECLNIKR